MTLSPSPQNISATPSPSQPTNSPKQPETSASSNSSPAKPAADSANAPASSPASISASSTPSEKPEPGVNVMLDLEALGLRPGCAIVEIGAVAFDLATGKTGETLHLHLAVTTPFWVDLQTLQWHGQKGTWPPPPGTFLVTPDEAADALTRFIFDLGTIDNVWSWGSTYDFPLLDALWQHTGTPCPWHYFQQCCARTVWRTVFGPDARRPPRTHDALNDCRNAISDLHAALSAR